MRKPRGKLTPEQRMTIVSRFRDGQGVSAKALAKEYGITPPAIYKMATKARKGVALRPRRGAVPVFRQRRVDVQLTPQQCRRIVTLVNSGITTGHVAAEAMLTDEQVRAVMAKWYAKHDCYGPAQEDDDEAEIAPMRTTTYYTMKCATPDCRHSDRPFKTNLNPHVAICPLCRVGRLGLTLLETEQVKRPIIRA